MTSNRDRSKRARSRGLNGAELELVDLVEEMLEQMRWLWILGYTNQFLLNQKLSVSKEERDKILAAAARSVDRDAKLHEWQERLSRIKGEALRMQRDVRRAAKGMARERRRGGDPAEREACDE